MLSSIHEGIDLTFIGNGTETCGGYSRLNIYKLGGTSPSPSPSDGSTTISTLSATLSSTQASEETVTSTSAGISTEVSTGTTTSTSSSTTRPAPTSTKPVEKETVGDWESQGCYLETDNGRALTGKTFADDDMTLEDCGEFCEGFTYFGVEYGRECYCGNTLKEGSVPAENQADCSFPCPGDRAYLCGAGMRLQLYKAGSASETTAPAEVTPSAVSSTLVETPASSEPAEIEEKSTSVSATSSSISTVSTSTESTTTPSTTAQTSSEEEEPTSTSTSASVKPTPTGPIVDEGNKNFTYYSCVQEPSAGRLLGDQIFNNGTHMTIDKCLERCWDFNYAGVEYGRECWCGDKLDFNGNAGATPGKNVTDDKCWFLCPGDDMKYCGSGGHMSLYVLKELAGSDEHEIGG